MIGGYRIEMICIDCMSIREVELTQKLTIDSSKFAGDAAKLCFCGGRLVLTDSIGGKRLKDRKATK